MKINHLNLTVTDTQAARRFFEKYCDLWSIDGTKDDDTFIAMKDESGFILTLMQAKKNAEVLYPATFHIGFLKQSEEQVYAMYELLKNDGFNVKPPRNYHGSSLDLYYTTPFGITIQVST